MEATICGQVGRLVDPIMAELRSLGETLSWVVTVYIKIASLGRGGILLSNFRKRSLDPL